MSRYILIWIIVFLAVELLGLLIIYIYSECKGFVVTEYNLTTNKNLKHNLNVVLISDLHNTDTGNNNQLLLDKIDEINPDFILVAGDMITSYMQPKYNSEITFSFLERLTKKYTVYYGLGNHEQRYLTDTEKFPGKYEKFYSAIKELGIHLLSDDYIVDEQSGCYIYGLNIPIHYYKRTSKQKLTEDYVKKVFGDGPKDEYSILLAHIPDHFEEYSKWNPDLVCSGHVHGGIVIIPKLGGVISPQFKLFPKYYGGLYECNKSRMILSRGLGWHTLPLRINNKAELIHITVTK